MKMRFSEEQFTCGAGFGQNLPFTKKMAANELTKTAALRAKGTGLTNT